MIRFSIAVACGIFGSVAVAQENVAVRNDGGSTSPNRVMASGPDNTEIRQVGKFSGIELDTAADASFSIGPNSSIAISGPANILPLVHTEVRNGALTVWLEKWVVMSKPLKLVITGPSLQAVSVPGSATMAASGLSADSLDISVSGSGVVSASGSVKNVTVAISGSGDVNVSAIHAKTLVATVSGSGRLRGHASDSATVEISGSGDVRIDGNPARRTVSRSGSGDVQFN
jgi:hypothetical protein